MTFVSGSRHGTRAASPDTAWPAGPRHPTRGEAVTTRSGSIRGRDGASRLPFGTGGASRLSPRPPGRGGGVAVKTRGAVVQRKESGHRPASPPLGQYPARYSGQAHDRTSPHRAIAIGPLGACDPVWPNAGERDGPGLDCQGSTAGGGDFSRSGDREDCGGSVSATSGSASRFTRRTPGTCTDGSPRDAASRRPVALTSPAAPDRMAP